jgi:hypothetical protein
MGAKSHYKGEIHMQLVDVFTEPGKLFKSLQEKPNFLLPLLLIAVFPALVWFLYYQRVDGSWLVDHILEQAKVAPARMAAARESMKPSIMMWGAVIGAPIAIGVWFLIMAGYYTLAAKIAGVKQGYKAWLSFAAWTSMPILLSTLVMLIGVLTMTAQTAPEALQLTHLDPLLLQLDADSAWKKFATSFDLLNFWPIWLSATGWRIWSGRGWGQAIVASALPSVLIYGIWAAVVALGQH